MNCIPQEIMHGLQLCIVSTSCEERNVLGDVVDDANDEEIVLKSTVV